MPIELDWRFGALEANYETATAAQACANLAEQASADVCSASKPITTQFVVNPDQSFTLHSTDLKGFPIDHWLTYIYQ